MSRDEKKPPTLIGTKKPKPVLFLRSKKLNVSLYGVWRSRRDYRKSPLDSIITTIATSNRCELDSLENLFSRESLRLGRWETLTPTGTAVVVIMKISKGLKCSPYGTPIKSF